MQVGKICCLIESVAIGPLHRGQMQETSEALGTSSGASLVLEEND